MDEYAMVYFASHNTTKLDTIGTFTIKIKLLRPAIFRKHPARKKIVPTIMFLLAPPIPSSLAPPRTFHNHTAPFQPS
jgi:hypothetical protein